MEYLNKFGVVMVVCSCILSRQAHGELTMKDMPTECFTYTEIDDDSRLFDNVDVPVSGEYDHYLKKDWYRFIGRSGNSLKEGYDQIIEPAKNVPKFCGTEFAGTLMGSHPTVEEGIVEMTVCFRASRCFKKGVDCGCEQRRTIYVLNCMNHYIYFLVPSISKGRYCSANTPIRKPDQNDTAKIVECNQYKSIPDDKVAVTRQWNKVTNLACDDQINGWFRFDTEIASECAENEVVSTTTLYRQPCGATFRGWMVDRHPTVEEGRVQRMVCFSYNKECRCEFMKNIAVRNCGQFFVYRLNSVPKCKARYCSAPKGRTSKVTDSKKPTITKPKDICKSYQVQYDPDRLWSFTSPIVKKCDANLYGNYRFGSKYTPWTIKEGCNTANSELVTNRCGTDFQGFMEGKHPTVKEGYVERVICFHQSEIECECKHTVKIGVQNCSNYIVYSFTGTPVCNARFCMVANNSKSIRLNPGVPPLYKLPPPEYIPPTSEVSDDNDDGGDSRLVTTTVVLSLIIFIILIIVIIIIILIVIRRFPLRKERKKQQPYIYEVHDHPTQPNSIEDPEKPVASKSNGDIHPKRDYTAPDPIEPYPSVPHKDGQTSTPTTAPPNDHQASHNSNNALDDIPVDLEMNDDYDDNDANDSDTLLKDADFMKPKSYDNLSPAQDSAV